MNRSIIISLSLLLLSVELHAVWLERKAEGWVWHENKPTEPLKKEEKTESTPHPAVKELAAIKQELEAKLATAILEPTVENVTAYIIEQKKWIDRSALFAEIWAKALLQHPEVDQTILTPVSQYAMPVYKETLQEEKELIFTTLSKDHGLFFFFNGACKRSQAFAKIVSLFAERYHWEVISVSLDGFSLPEFPQPKKDNSIAKHFKLDYVPALFVVNPISNETISAAYGMVSMDQLEQNILLQFQHMRSAAHVP